MNVNPKDKLQCLIFDGDDTLWSTMPLYTDAKMRFQSVMEHLKMNGPRAIAKLDDIDSDAVRQFGFSKKRFPRSMVETYRAFALAKHKTPSRAIEHRIKKIGETVFNRKVRCFPGVKRTLKALQEHRLVLFTKGEREVQEKRILESGLRSFFKSIYITAAKSRKELRELLRSEGRLAPKDTWIIGDSYRSDIKPALALGLHAIWIPRQTWRYECHKAVPTHNRLQVCASICEVPDLIKSAT